MSGTGLTRQIIGSGVEDGIPYIDMRLWGTSGGGHYTIVPDNGWSHVSAAVGQVWTHSIYARLIAGTPRVTRSHLRQREGGGTLLGDLTTLLTVPTAGPLAANRMVATAILTQAATARLEAFYQINYAAGTVIDDTWRLALPQLELGAFPSSPILPAPEAVAVSSRGNDVLSLLLADVLVPASGACTLLLAGRLGQAAPAGITQMLAQIDDGTGRIAAAVDGVVGHAAEGVQAGGRAAHPRWQQQRGGEERLRAAAHQCAAGLEVGVVVDKRGDHRT
jgi:hypothetical protein